MILFDARHIENEYSGLGRYTAALGLSLMKVLGDDELVILIPQEKTNRLIELIKLASNENLNVSCEETSIPLYGIRHHLCIGKLKSVVSCDLFIYPHFDVPFSVSAKVLYIVHDTFILDVPGYITKNVLTKKFYFWFVHNFQSMRPKSVGVCVSENTKNDIANHLLRNKSKIHHVLSGLTRFDNSSKEIDLPEDYLLYVGDRRPHKNLKTMIDSFLLLKQNPKYQKLFFLIVGSTEEYGCGIQKMIDENEAIIALTNVLDEELNFLYENTRALFFLTQYEGFGLPILEAWSWGRKIIAANIGGAVEIAPKGSLLLDPFSEPGFIASNVASYLSSDAPIQDIDQKLFSWDSTASEILSIGRNVK